MPIKVALLGAAGAITHLTDHRLGEGTAQLGEIAAVMGR